MRWLCTSMRRPFVPIDDPHDPRVAAYVAVRERDVVGRDGDFIAEGEVVIRTLATVQNRCAVRSLLIARSRLGRAEGFVGAFAEDVPVFVAEQPVMDAVVGFPIHRGLLALARRPAELHAAELLAGLPERALVLVALGISNHDNMGGLFRNAAAFGIDAVLIDARCCDPLYRKSVRVSVGAALKVSFARIPAGQDPIELLEEARVVPVGLSGAARRSVGSADWPARAGLLFGSEGPGLPQALLDRAQSVSIPMAPGWDSLNVAAASAVALYCATAARRR